MSVTQCESRVRRATREIHNSRVDLRGGEGVESGWGGGGDGSHGAGVVLWGGRGADLPVQNARL